MAATVFRAAFTSSDTDVEDDAPSPVPSTSATASASAASASASTLSLIFFHASAVTALVWMLSAPARCRNTSMRGCQAA